MNLLDLEVEQKKIVFIIEEVLLIAVLITLLHFISFCFFYPELLFLSIAFQVFIISITVKIIKSNRIKLKIVKTLQDLEKDWSGNLNIIKESDKKQDDSSVLVSLLTESVLTDFERDVLKDIFSNMLKDELSVSILTRAFKEAIFEKGIDVRGTNSFFEYLNNLVRLASKFSPKAKHIYRTSRGRDIEEI